MKKLLSVLLVSVCSLFFLNGCAFVNPYTKTLEDIRNQNIEGVFTAYETAFKGIHVDYIENASEQYRRDRENDLLLSGYQLFSGKTPEEIKQTPLFSMVDIAEIDKVYQERTQHRIKEINNSFTKFNATVGNAKITIRTIERKVEELKKQREQAIKEAIAIGLSTVTGVTMITVVAP